MDEQTKLLSFTLKQKAVEGAQNVALMNLVMNGVIVILAAGSIIFILFVHQQLQGFASHFLGDAQINIFGPLIVIVLFMAMRDWSSWYRWQRNIESCLKKNPTGGYIVILKEIRQGLLRGIWADTHDPRFPKRAYVHEVQLLRESCENVQLGHKMSASVYEQSDDPQWLGPIAIETEKYLMFVKPSTIGFSFMLVYLFGRWANKLFPNKSL